MNIARYPLLLFLDSVFVLGLSAWLGAFYRTRHCTPERDAEQRFGLVTGATLTLFWLIGATLTLLWLIGDADPALANPVVIPKEQSD